MLVSKDTIPERRDFAEVKLFPHADQRTRERERGDGKGRGIFIYHIEEASVHHLSLPICGMCCGANV